MRAWSELSPMGRKIAVNLAILAVLVAVIAAQTDRFLDVTNFENVLRQVAVVVIVACAVTLVMIAGGLDLSVGGVVALSGVNAALLAADGAPLWVAMLAGVATGAFVGLVNGVLVVQLGLNSVIATLGSLYVSRGTAYLLTDGVPVSGVPPTYSDLGSGDTLGVPTPVVIMVVVVAALALLQGRTTLGRHAVAVGSNFEAARLSGVRVNRVRIALFVIAGAAAGLGGVIVSSRLSSGQPTAGMGLEFDTIVAAVLGGTSLAGGEGSVLGTALGALIIGVVNNGLNLLGVQSFWQTIVQGVILVLAVGIDALVRRRSVSDYLRLLRVRRPPARRADSTEAR